MKKALKIIGITLGSVVVVFCLAIVLLCTVIVSPKQLTPLVHRAADTLLTCPHELEEVNLTFFRTFPNFGVAVRGLALVNPMEGAQSDTLVAVDELVVGLDILKAMDGDIHIRTFRLIDARANLYIAEDGATNMDILRLPERDSTKRDTTASDWQLRSVEWDDVLRITSPYLSLADRRDSILASLTDLQLSLDRDAHSLTLDAQANNVYARIKGVQYANGLNVKLNVPVEYNSDTTAIHTEGIHLDINSMALDLSGDLSTPAWHSGVHHCDLRLQTNEWQIAKVLSLLPDQYRRMIPSTIEADGMLSMDAHIAGTYDSVSMPLVDATISLNQGHGHIDRKVLPYDIDDLQLYLQAHADLNQKAQTRVSIAQLKARAGTTELEVTGDISHILRDGKEIALANPKCLLSAKVDADLQMAQPWIKSDSVRNEIKGRLKGMIQVNTRLSDLQHMNYPAIRVQGNLAVKDLDVIWADTIFARSKRLNVELQTPRSDYKGNRLSADCNLSFDSLGAMIPTTRLDAGIASGTMDLAVELDTKDKKAIPYLEVAFDMTDLKGKMDTMTIHAVAPQGTLSMRESRKMPGRPALTAGLKADALQAKMGKYTRLQTDGLDIKARSVVISEEKLALLKYNPMLDFDLHNGQVELPSPNEKISIPAIKFHYSNRDFRIDTSRIVIGNSDFALAGEVKGLGKWLRHQGVLNGELRFTSDHTDVNELMAIVNDFNAKHAAADTTAAAPAKTDNTPQETNPFMVPEQVELSLLTHIKSADVFQEHLKNLGGKLYIHEGTLILEEMGFMCEAAKLQLTAMYRTPRKEHLYVGLDYHMVDIDLEHLIKMIPQLDTLVPMLNQFRGKAQFHIAAETYVNDHYQLKPSTLRGACSIEGKDLVLLDSETFGKISKLLLFNRKTENLVDSISAQISLYKDEVTVYPFCLSMDKYMVAVGGTHYLDMSFNYHASVLSPVYLGVDVGGKIGNLDIKMAKCRYAQDFRPIIHKDVETKAAELKRIISDSLKKNVKL